MAAILARDDSEEMGVDDEWKFCFPADSSGDGVDERVNREQRAADDDADEAGHDDHKDGLNHGGDVVDLFV